MGLCYSAFICLFLHVCNLGIVFLPLYHLYLVNIGAVFHLIYFATSLWLSILILNFASTGFGFCYIFWSDFSYTYTLIYYSVKSRNQAFSQYVATWEKSSSRTRSSNNTNCGRAWVARAVANNWVNYNRKKSVMSQDIRRSV